MLVPVHFDAAKAFVAEHHRHSEPPLQARYAAGVAVDGDVLAVVIAGRPVARGLQDGWTQEVLRVCTPGADVEPRVRNACSKLYGAAWRAIRALGYLRAITYTTNYETGASARAAGFLPVAVKVGRDWDTPARRRDCKQQVDGVRWEIRTAMWHPDLVGPPVYVTPKANPNQMEIAA
jgi:hypothetical protein